MSIHVHYVKCSPLRRNIILTKSSLLHFSSQQKVLPLIPHLYLRILLRLAVAIFNKLDPKVHDSRDTEIELTFSQCQDLQRGLLNGSFHLEWSSEQRGPGMRVSVISTLLLT